ncbi:MAG: hypothetical protein JEY91_14740, partial [Spirochaetaceae bacterium]|nr:hypothetical protein [Spirochaetaceae bacterium]
MRKVLLLIFVSFITVAILPSEGQQDAAIAIPPVDMDRDYVINIGTWSQELATTYTKVLESEEF